MAKFFLSPSNQTDNRYAWGNTTERDVCGKIAIACKEALLRNGQEVLLMHDERISEKVAASNAWGADYYIPIHSNAFNGKVSGTRMFYGVDSGLCKAIFNRLAPFTPGTSENIKQSNLAEIVQPSAISAFVEVDFHDVPDVAKWIVENTTQIGETIAHGVCDYLGVEFTPIGADIPSANKEPENPAEQPKEEAKKTLYRVRKAWADKHSQIGAFAAIENAKRACQEGYFVYDEEGTALFYRVAANDSLWAISIRAYGSGAQYKKIMDANGMATSVIYACQLLIIPKP